MGRHKGGSLEDSMKITIFFGVLLLLVIITLTVLGVLGYLTPGDTDQSSSGTGKADYPGNINITRVTVPYPGSYGFTVNLDTTSYVCNSCTAKIQSKVRYSDGTTESLPVKTLPIAVGTAGQSTHLQPSKSMPISSVQVTAYQENSAGVKGTVSSMSAGVGPNIHN